MPDPQERRPVRSKTEAILALVVSSQVMLALLFGTNFLVRRWTGTDLETATAAVSQSAMRLLGAGAERDANYLSYGGKMFEVVTECTGLTVLVLLGTFIFAFPASWRRKIQGFLGAAVLLFVTNVIRIVVVLLSTSGGEWFGLLHDVGWPAFIILMACGYFSIWAAWPQRAGAARWGV